NTRIGLVNLLFGALIRLAILKPNDEFFTREDFTRGIKVPPAELGSFYQEMQRDPRIKRRTIHHYFPGDDISGDLGLLNFDRDRIGMLIERGFQDAVEHNCQTSNCVRREDPIVLLPLQADSSAALLPSLA